MRVSHYLFVLAAAVAAVTASPAARDGLPWEVFAFVVKATPSEWSQYDWTKITTVGLYDMKPDFIEHANELNVKVVSVTDIDGKKMLNKTYRAEWVRQTVDFAVQHKLNGTNLDFEEEVEAGSEKAQALTDLMTELSAAFKEVMPFSVVSLDVPYAPNCTYNRCFDMEAIAKVADYLVVMAYDEPSIRKDAAGANSPAGQTFQGIREYVDKFNVPANKLILACPWYGYDHTCCSLSADGTCSKSGCGNAKQTPGNYNALVDLERKWGVPRHWDDASMSPYFNYSPDGNKTMHQVWFDDPYSLGLKYVGAVERGMLGVGMWTANSLDYGNVTQVQEMWSIIPGK